MTAPISTASRARGQYRGCGRARVDHRPLELVRGRHSDDLVIDIVQIAICLYLHTAQSSALEGPRVDHAEVVLRGVLGAEVLIPDEGIVQVVEVGMRKIRL